MSSYKTLVVDDDEQFCFVLKRALERRDFQVDSYSQSAPALSAIAKTNYDFAIVDLKIAQESGLELIKEMKLLRPNLRILMLTGYSSIATAVEAIKLGAENYLAKPADADEILRALKLESGTLNNKAQAQITSVERVEWEHIQKVLQENQGNISATARALNMHRRTLQRKLLKRPQAN